MNAKRKGRIWSYSTTKFVGSIQEDVTGIIWFFHQGRIIKALNSIEPGAQVLFVGDEEQPVKEGMLRSAYQIQVLNAGPADLLGAKTAEGK